MTTTVMGRWWRGLLALCLAMTLTACASGPKLVSHGFSFDGWNDHWAETAQLLEYSYGDQYRMVQRKAPEGDFLGYQSGIHGPMPVGDFLYVKWRLKASGEVFEQRVDLRNRLPRDMSDHELTFVIDGRQLYVYVVTPRRKTSSTELPTPLKTWRSEFAYAYEIYPTIQKP